MKVYTELQTMAITYKEICEGQRPWNPLGNFMNDFFGNFPDRREELVKDPMEEPKDATPEMHKWAVFCAASVEYLCEQYNLSCPDWVNNPTYILAEPWYDSPGAEKPTVRERLKQKTPSAWTKRNIYCGNRVFWNKYELPTKKKVLA